VQAPLILMAMLSWAASANTFAISAKGSAAGWRSPYSAGSAAGFG
jgi:hypothetical protein